MRGHMPLRDISTITCGAANSVVRFDVDAFLTKHETLLVAVLCLAAALRVFLFSAAFPFFTNMDEQAHFDVVYRYARGSIPDGLECYTPQSTRFIVLYGSPEYLRGPQDFPNNRIPPPVWVALSRGEIVPVQQAVAEWTTESNPEATQPPVYYAMAAAWFRIGELLGVRDSKLLYWLRFMNVLIYGLLVWTSYMFVRRMSGSNSFLRLSVPAIVAFFPQDVFYSLNNDVPSALLCGLSLLCMYRVYAGEARGYGAHTLTGFVAGAAFLTKFSNFPVLVALGWTIVMRAIRLRPSGELKRHAGRLAALLSAAAFPVSAWLLRNYLVLGDITGSAEKITRLGWRVKALSDVRYHPLFTLDGIRTFWDDLMRTFWRGEIVWHGSPMHIPAGDVFYSLSSLVLLVSSVVGLAYCRRKLDESERFLYGVGLLVVVLSVLFLAAVSVVYDYGDCWYPSEEHPFFTSGRLISGMMIPFIALYVTGLQMLLSRLRISRNRLLVVFVIVAFMVGSEVKLTHEVFNSAYNWFHTL